MAGLSGLVQTINELVAGTPSNDDCFIFGKTSLKKITLTNLKNALGIDSLNSALKDNLNQNRIELTNSSYYPDAICYRSGQAVYIKCAGTIEKTVPADSPLVVGIESMMPEEFRPNANIVAYPNISLGGKQIKLEITTTGRVIFTSAEQLNVGFGINLHFSYMTGKSNF